MEPGSITPSISPFVINQAVSVLTDKTKENWNYNGHKITLEMTLKGSSAETVLKNTQEKFKNLFGLQLNQNQLSVSREKGPEQIFHLRINIDPGKDAFMIQKLANQNSKFLVGEAKTKEVDSQLSPQKLSQAVKYLNARTKEFSWNVQGNQLMCVKNVPFSANVNSYEEGGEEVRKQLEALDLLDVNIVPSLRGGGGKSVNVVCTISNPQVIDRLSDLANPVVELRDVEGRPRTLTSASATLAVMVSDGFRKSEILQQGPNPESKLPLPWMNLTVDGLEINIPKELANRQFVASLQKLVGKPVIAYRDPLNKFGRSYTDMVVIPPSEIRGFFEKTLKMDKVKYPDGVETTFFEDMLAVKQSSSSPFTRTQLKAFNS